MIDVCHLGDCRDVMRRMFAAGVRVQTCITSPPYFGLRDYGIDGQLGLEPTVEKFVATIVDVFRGVRRVLADDGTLWLNLGDSYAGSRGSGPPSARSTLSGNGHEGGGPKARNMTASRRRDNEPVPRSDLRLDGMKPKDMLGIPWRVALALQADGWYLRQDIIWHKPNPMPESVRDRCTKAHEYLFLLSKSARYYFDADAIAEPRASARRMGSVAGHAHGAGDHSAIAHSRERGDAKGFRGGAYVNFNKFNNGAADKSRINGNQPALRESRGRRSVWSIAPEPYPGAHFATFPEALVEPCVLAGSRVGDVVFDPFMGTGTVAGVAQRLGRRWIGAELNPAYITLQAQRVSQYGMELA